MCLNSQLLAVNTVDMVSGCIHRLADNSADRIAGTVAGTAVVHIAVADRIADAAADKAVLPVDCRMVGIAVVAD